MHCTTRPVTSEPARETMRRRDALRGDDDDDDSEDEAPVHAPGSTAELVAQTLQADSKTKKPKAGGARATVLPSGNDSDEDDVKGETANPKSVSFAEGEDDFDDLARKSEGAAKRRALLRSELAANMREAGDVDARERVEDAEIEGKDDESLMAFNLDKERQEGYFDDDGNYVEYAEEKDETDLWLDKDAKVDERLASGAIKRSTAALEEEEDAQAMTERDVAEMQREIAGYLKPGETVLGALKRLGGKTSGKKGGPPSKSASSKPEKPMSAEDKRAFDRLTELSSALMGNGEYEVYTFQKEAFERAAKIFAPATALVDDAGAKDMFADSDDEEDAKAPEPPAKKAKTDEDSTCKVDFSGFSVKQLKTYITTHGGTIRGAITEKSELLALAKQCSPAVVPEGYENWSAEKGMYYSAAADLYFDATTNLFTDGTQHWYYDQAQGGFVEWSG